MKKKFLTSLLVFGSVFALASCGTTGNYEDYLNNIQGRVITKIYSEEDTEALDKTNVYAFNLINYEQKVEEFPKYNEDGKFMESETKIVPVKYSVRGKIGTGFNFTESAAESKEVALDKKLSLDERFNIKLNDTIYCVSDTDNKQMDVYYDTMIAAGQSELLPSVKCKDENGDDLTDENGNIVYRVINETEFKKDYVLYKTDKYNYVKESKTYKYNDNEEKDDYVIYGVKDNKRYLDKKDTSIYADFIKHYENGFKALSKALELFDDVNHLHDAESGEKPIFIEPCNFELNGDGSISYLTYFEEYKNTCRVTINYTHFKGISDLGNLLTRKQIYINTAEVRSTTDHRLLLEFDNSKSLKKFNIVAPKL